MRRTRSLTAFVSLLTIAALVFGAAAVIAKPKTKTKKGKKDSGTVYVAIDRQSGGYDYISGIGTDKLFGASAATFKVKQGLGSKPGTVLIAGKPVTVWTKTGTLTGSGSATLTVGAGGAATVSNGKLTLKKGTGGLKGHSLNATYTGTGNAVSGQYTFHYTGTYR